MQNGWNWSSGFRDISLQFEFRQIDGYRKPSVNWLGDRARSSVLKGSVPLLRRPNLPRIVAILLTLELPTIDVYLLLPEGSKWPLLFLKSCFLKLLRHLRKDSNFYVFIYFLISWTKIEYNLNNNSNIIAIIY